MREIKFRAWDIINKEYVNLNDSMSSIPYYELFCHTPDSRAMELEQFTGLKDKNGVEIYEGDIITDGESIGRIWWRNDLARWVCSPDIVMFSLSEVIGNIHENPELLK